MSSVLSFHIGVYDRLTQRTITLLEYSVVDEPELKELYLSDSRFVSENAIPLRPGEDRVDMLNPPISVRHIKRFFKYVEIARIVSLFVETMVEMCKDEEDEHRSYRASSLARIFARGGETLADIATSCSPEPLIGIIQVARLYEFNRLHKLAIQCMAVLLSVPQETKWTEEDMKKVWSSLGRIDSITLRRNLYGLPWYERPEAVRYRAVDDLRKMWKQDLVDPANRCVEEAMKYLEPDFVIDGVSPLRPFSNRITDPLTRAFAISHVASSLAREKRNVVVEEKVKRSFKDRTRDCIDNMQRRLRSSSSDEVIEKKKKKVKPPKSLLFVRAKPRLDKENSSEERRKVDEVKTKRASKSLLFVKPRSRLNLLARPRGPITRKRKGSKRKGWR
eukprot:g2536.t1